LSQGITSIEDLRQHQDKLTAGQKIGLRYHEDFSRTMPRTEVEAIFDKIQKVLNALDSGLVATLCGAYRKLFPQLG
jgi:hypothetical protein